MIEHLGLSNFIFIITAFCFAAVSIVGYLNSRYTFSILFLVLSALILRLTIASLDPFLYLWDEQFHALVAKNMINNPFKPMLYANPVLDYNYKWWDVNHVWLHKQPLFLWLMALSIKIFGATAFAVRVPSAILFSLISIFIFRIGSIVVHAKAGWWAAFLFSFSWFFLEVATGSIHTDHNDVHFIFFVTASIWSFFEYQHSSNKKWIVLIGLFAGFAVLTKWLTGLLVYFLWMITKWWQKQFKINQYADYIIALSITIFVVTPWQIYAWQTFPMEYTYEMQLNTKHFFEEVEGHAENWYFHFIQFPMQYGLYSIFILPFALFVFFKTVHNVFYKLVFVSAILFIYLFFTISVTKMPLFTSILAPMIFVIFGTLAYKTEEYIFRAQYNKRIYFLLPTIIMIAVFSSSVYDKIIYNHTSLANNNYLRTRNINNYEINKSVAQLLPNTNCVVFNCKRFNAVPFMYQTGLTGYGTYPTDKEYRSLKSKNIGIAVFVDEKTPEFLLKDSSVLKLNYKISE